MRDVCKRKIYGFSLIEVSIVLLIAGIIFGAVLKGKDLIEQAKIRSVAADFFNLQSFISLYSTDYNDLFDQPFLVWEKLHAASMAPSPNPPNSKLGGSFSISRIYGKHYLTLAAVDHEDEGEGRAFLTFSQAKSLYAKLTSDQSGDSDAVIVQNSKGDVVNINKIKYSTNDRFSVSLLIE
ncbi:MAG: prepilin-type N-terminal cleavage/methylation domain-containing protein [Holosporales bacterium]|jgi:prepilin-type N-terminal cleavage/methylation domain-containing protein|nr:prepilin-type N-terminal cleavage/methylation domain-containing protein [Holosporales bacterium]